MMSSSLQEQCKWYILMHLEKFPSSFTALLPLSMREELMWRLPVADVCILESSPFVDGLDLEKYWQYVCSKWTFPYLNSEVHSETWMSQHGKLHCYAKVVQCVVFKVRDNCPHVIHFQSGEFDRLFAVRKLVSEGEHNCYEFVYPVRYSKYQCSSDHHYTNKEKIGALTDCFRGLPQELTLYAGLNIPTSKMFVDFLSDLKCLKVMDCGLIPAVTKAKTKSLLNVIKKASKLEILSIQRCGNSACRWSPEFHSLLSLSRLPQLEIKNFSMSQYELYHILRCFLSAPCTQAQKIKIDGELYGSSEHTCMCKNTSFWPQLDETQRCYLHLKTVEIKCATCDVCVETVILYGPGSRKRNLKIESSKTNCKRPRRK